MKFELRNTRHKVQGATLITTEIWVDELHVADAQNCIHEGSEKPMNSWIIAPRLHALYFQAESYLQEFGPRIIKDRVSIDCDMQWLIDALCVKQTGHIKITQEGISRPSSESQLSLMTKELQLWCKSQNLPFSAAQDLLADVVCGIGQRSPLATYQADYLRNFIDRWDQAEEAA
jgi:hypothetical protein